MTSHAAGRFKRGSFPAGACSVLLAAALLGIGQPAGAQAPMVKGGATIRVSDGVYVIPDNRVNLVPNIGIVVGEKGILVVDTGMGPSNAETVLEEVRRISDKEILYLTVTHFHPEHGMGAEAFPPGVTVIYPKAQKVELADKGEVYLKLFSGFSPEIAELIKDVRIVPADIAYSGETELNLGDFPVQLFHLGPTHTRGDNFVFLPEQKILFAGDVVVNRFFPIMPDTDSSGSHWIQVLQKLEELAPAKVVPGHGAVGNVKLITRMKDYLTSLRDRVETLVREGKSLEEIQKTVDPEFQRKYKNWDNPEWIKNAIETFHRELSAG